MNSRLKIRSVMHPMPHTIGVSQSLRVAKDVMSKHGIRHLPVRDGGSLIGILSDRDIEFALRVERKDPEEVLIREAYTADPYAVPADTLVSEVARRMAHDHIGCALVVENEALVGIFTTVDACRTLAELLSGVNEN